MLSCPSSLRLLLQHFAVPDDGVHGGAEFVAHVGEELALGAVGRFRRVFGRAQTLLGLVALDADRHLIGDRGHCVQRGTRQRVPGEHRHHADQAVFHDQRIACKRHHALAPRPLLIAHTGVAHHAVR